MPILIDSVWNFPSQQHADIRHHWLGENAWGRRLHRRNAILGRHGRRSKPFHQYSTQNTIRHFLDSVVTTTMPRRVKKGGLCRLKLLCQKMPKEFQCTPTVHVFETQVLRSIIIGHNDHPKLVTSLLGVI